MQSTLQKNILSHLFFKEPLLGKMLTLDELSKTQEDWEIYPRPHRLVSEEAGNQPGSA